MAKKKATRKRVAKKKRALRLPADVTTWADYFQNGRPNACYDGQQALEYAVAAERKGWDLAKIWKGAPLEYRQLALGQTDSDGSTVDYALDGDLWDEQRLDLDAHINNALESIDNNFGELAPNVVALRTKFVAEIKKASKVLARLQQAYDAFVTADPVNDKIIVVPVKDRMYYGLRVVKL